MKELLLSESRLESYAELIKNSMVDIIKDANAKGAVIGLSGGIDSSVVASLASESGVDVYALIMPEMSLTKKEDTKDAEELAIALGLKYSLIEIDPMITAFEENFPWGGFEKGRKKLSSGNMRARIRMILNYLLANLDNRIVLGTGNKTEILLGYGTKHGDCAADILPIGELYKTQVIQMARFLEIPDSIINKEPSAGLWKGQTDKQELGATYEDIDRILFHLVEKKMSPMETSKELDVDPNLVNDLYERMQRNRHKSEVTRITKLFD